jgi:hypothetical protein
MNRAAIAVSVIVSSLQLGWAFCPDGTVDWKGGCAAMLKPQGGPENVVPSKEKAPKGKMPSYQREGIKVIEIPSFKTEAEEADAQIKYAQAHPAAKTPASIQVSADAGKKVE